MSRLVVRAPNHLGDLVMALPALRAAQPDAVLVSRWLAPLVRMAGFTAIPLDRGPRGFLAAVVQLRRENFSRAILLTPSFSSALMVRLGGVRFRRGTETDGRGFLLTARIDRSLLEQQHRATAYMTIATDDTSGARPVPWLAVPDSVTRKDDKQVRTGPAIAICPGSNAASRAWPADRFANLARHLSKHATVLVFGGPNETALTATVAGDWAIDMGGKTDLAGLAAGLSSCDLAICNDSGPLHLAAAVGTRTISFWGAGDPARTGPPPGHQILRHTELPCLECVKNQCPRSGPGYILPDAHNECLHLISVDAALEAAQTKVAD